MGTARMTGWVESIFLEHCSSSDPRGPSVLTLLVEALCQNQPALHVLLGVSVILAIYVWEEMKGLPFDLIYFLISEH